MTVKTLQIQNFTVFQDAQVTLGPEMNVVVGANGAGKSHLLKLAYSAAAASYQAKQESKTEESRFAGVLQEKIMDVFRAETLENLVYGRTYPTEAQVSVHFENRDIDVAFYIPYPSEKKTAPITLGITTQPKEFVDKSPVFIPTREILSIIPAFSKFHREKDLLLDGTYFDLSFLAQMAADQKIHADLKEIVSRLSELLEGTVIQESGRFYLKHASGFKMEMPLVAEGLRKIAMLSCLLENAAIQPGTLLLWDEPEANLNPLLMTELAQMLVRMSSLNMQVVVATHSLFFLREIHICLTQAKRKGRFFALDKRENAIHVSQGDSIDEIEPISALEADLKQTDRYLTLED